MNSLVPIPNGDNVCKIGPQLPGESGLSARVRLHQSWFRAEVLELQTWGTTKAPGRRPLGSILSQDDAAAGLAFTSAAAEHLFESRRRQGWGIDPGRTRTCLTSSQGLTLNLFGPLVADLPWAGRTFCLAWKQADCEVRAIEIEFAPAERSKYLNDMTRIDVLLTLSVGGVVRLLALETKLCDRWGSRFLNPHSTKYAKVAESLGMWRMQSIVFSGRKVNQLLRGHMLASLVARKRGIDGPAGVMLLALKEDSSSHAVAESYASCLRDPTLMTSVNLCDFISAMEDSAESDDQRSVAALLKQRYVEFSLSDAAWEILKSAKLG